jgi:hypothetical protein
MAAAKHRLDRDAVPYAHSPSLGGKLTYLLDEAKWFVAGDESEIEVHQLGQVTVKSFDIRPADAARLHTKPGFLWSDLRPYIPPLFKRFAPCLNHRAD